MEQEFKPEVTAIQVQVNRTSDGLTIETRVSPKIENFFKHVGQDQVEKHDLRVTGRNWTLKSGEIMMPLYLLGENLVGVIPLRQGPILGYRLDSPGRRIIEPDKSGNGFYINISFIRMQGISDKGIHFTVRGVYSRNQVAEVRDGILAAINAFCDSFLSPINYTINLVEG